MNDSETSNKRHCPPGFTVVELVVVLTLSAVVLVGVLSVVSAETKRLSLEREISDTRYTLRAAAALISWDLRQAAAGDGALGTITDTSFVVRSPIATGVLCAKKLTVGSTDYGYSLTDVTGDFSSGADSVQILYADQSSGGGNTLRVSSWEYFRVNTIGMKPASPVGPALCVNPTDGAAAVGLKIDVPDVQQEVLDDMGDPVLDAMGNKTFTLVPMDTGGIVIGVPFLAYRRILYGIVRCRPNGSTCMRDATGDSWIGRQVGVAIGTDTWEPLTGPLQADGLDFSYYSLDSDGTETATADPNAVVAVRIIVRAKSAGRTLSREQIQDSLTVRINLRNCDPNVC
jgi:type II secretory pathway pseudopilin PulG